MWLTPLVLGLGAVCAVIILSVPIAAARGWMHIPGYVGLALVTFAAAFICGRISGVHRIRGTLTGEILSILCFLLVAVAIGSVLALFFHRERPQE